MTASQPSTMQRIFSRNMLICIFTGFTSGLPLYFLYSLIPAWLRSEHVDLKTIGLFALIGFPSLSFVDKTISRLPYDEAATYPMLPMYRDDNEREFVVRLSHTVFLKGDEYEQMISKIAPKWDIERITKMEIGRAHV